MNGMQTTQQNFDALIARNLSSHLSSRLTDDRAMQLSLLVPHSMSLANNCGICAIKPRLRPY